MRKILYICRDKKALGTFQHNLISALKRDFKITIHEMGQSLTKKQKSLQEYDHIIFCTDQDSNECYAEYLENGKSFKIS